MSSATGSWRSLRLICAVGLLAAMWGAVLSAEVIAQEARLELFPIRPIYVEVAYRQTFSPNGHEVGVQAGFTALRYGDLELNGTYQYFGLLSKDEKSDLHSVYVNPRWNNFLDVLDFPSGRPINRVLRHLLFGPLADRAVPFIGLLGGTVLTGPGAPTYAYGAQVGVRFPVAHSVALEIAVGYFAYGVQLHEESGQQRQLLLATGFAF